MPFVGRIGEAVQTLAEVGVEWKIGNFPSLSHNTEDRYLSPSFGFADSRWHFSLHPSEQLDEDPSIAVVRLSLRREDSQPSKTVTCALGIQYPDGKRRKKEVEGLIENVEWTLYWGSRAALDSELRPDDILTFTCHLKCSEPDVARASLSSRLWGVSRDLKTVLSDGKTRADFVLKVGGREWAVHKAVLEGRSEYFANMFRHDWVENGAGEVTFEDVEEEAMASVLDFLYTGRVEDVSVENVCEIYAAAHKFLLDDLKALCVEYMKGNMCGVEMPCRVFVTADAYGEGELRDSAVEYVLRGADWIFHSEEWKRFKQNHLSIAAMILEETTKRRRIGP